MILLKILVTSLCWMFVYSRIEVQPLALKDLPLHYGASKSYFYKDDQVKSREFEPQEPEEPHERRLLETNGPRCPATIDLVFNQDTSTSVTPRQLKNIANSLYDLFPKLTEDYPHTRFGLTSYNDKPKVPFGTPGEDHCYEAVIPLGNDIQAFHTAYATMPIGEGGDIQEAQYVGLMAAAQDDSLGWRGEEAIEGGNTIPVAKIILTITDSWPHTMGDDDLRGAENSGLFPPSCQDEDYPTFTQIKKAIKLRSPHLVPSFMTRTNTIKPSRYDAVTLYQEFTDLVMSGLGEAVEVDSLIEHDLYKALYDIIDKSMEEYCKVTSGPICPVTDFILVRDQSGSSKELHGTFEKWFKNEFGLTPHAFNFAGAYHSDKQFLPFSNGGHLDDFCCRVENYLLPYQAALDKQIYRSQPGLIGSEGDVEENQLECAITAMFHFQLTQWDTRCNCILFVTDGSYHIAGDWPEGTKYDMETPECFYQDYPSLKDFLTAMEIRELHCIRVATMSKVESHWIQFGEDLASAGYTGSYSIDIMD